MDRNQAKALLPFIQAYAEGKKIIVKDKRLSDKEYNWSEIDDCSFNFEQFEYRIKPETTYRPFANAEECWQEMQKHQPIGWVKSKEATKDIYFTITGLTNVIHGVILNSTGGWNFSGLFDYYTFADGTPFGVKEEE